MTQNEQGPRGAEELNNIQGSAGRSPNTDANNAGRPDDVLDAATGAAGMTGSGGPTDGTDLGRPRNEGGDLSERDLAREPMRDGAGAATSGTDIGSNSA